MEHGTLSCTLSAEAGGSVVAFTCAGADVFAPLTQGLLAPPSALPSAGSYPLVPYSNRLANAQLHWRSQTYALRPNFLPELHAIHGIGWQRAWAVIAVDSQSATLRYAHAPDADWPFAFEATQTFSLSADTLRFQLNVKNLAAHAAPIGLGWHPYFVKRPHARITFAARGRWEMGADQLPTHRAVSTGIDSDCAQLNVDHCFDDWSGDLQLRDEQLHTSVRSNMRHLVVYTRSDIASIATEPVSHVNNAFNLIDAGHFDAAALGVNILDAGASTQAWMTVQVNPAKR